VKAQSETDYAAGPRKVRTVSKEKKFADVDQSASESVELLSTKDTFAMIADTFNNYCRHYQKRVSWFYKGRMLESEKTRNRAEERMRRLIMLAVACETEIETFMKAQFEMLVPYFAPKGIPVRFEAMVTDTAIDRFLRYKERIKAQYKRESDRERALYSAPKKDIVTAIFNSATAFASVLIKKQKALGQLPAPEDALELLEVMAKAGIVTRLYVVTSPLLKMVEELPEFFTKATTEVWSSLTKEESYELQRVRDELSRTVEESEVGRYV